MAIKIALQSKRVGNHAFFCPETRLHLTFANPIGITDRVSKAILRGLRSGSLIDVDHVINLETGELNPPEIIVESPQMIEEAPVIEEVLKVKPPVKEIEKPKRAIKRNQKTSK